jgi:hypothetical protein
VLIISVDGLHHAAGQRPDPRHRAAMFADLLPPGTIFTSNVNHGPELPDIF